LSPNEFGKRYETSRMIAGVGPTLLKVVHYAGYITFYRGDPGVEFSPGSPLSDQLRAAFVARDGFALARLWLDHVAGGG
jgi:hypothetical protein